MPINMIWLYFHVCIIRYYYFLILLFVCKKMLKYFVIFNTNFISFQILNESLKIQKNMQLNSHHFVTSAKK